MWLNIGAEHFCGAIRPQEGAGPSHMPLTAVTGCALRRMNSSSALALGPTRVVFWSERPSSHRQRVSSFQPPAVALIRVCGFAPVTVAGLAWSLNSGQLQMGHGITAMLYIGEKKKTAPSFDLTTPQAGSWGPSSNGSKCFLMSVSTQIFDI